MPEISQVHQHFSGGFFKEHAGGLRVDRDYALDEMEMLLPKIGIGFNRGVLERAMDYAMDADITLPAQNISQLLTTASISTPLQFLQNWLPGIVQIVTAKRSIDDLIGRTTIGNWSDEQIVQPVIALTGSPQPYHDATNTPLTSWNQTFLTRTVQRFELGLRVGDLEEARSAAVRVDSAAQKRGSVALQLEIQRNAVGFYGYNSGLGSTYGFLNDPNEPAYVSAVNGNWNTATFAQMQQDILTALQTLRTQTQGVVTPNKDAITMAISTNRIDYLSTSTDFGYSVKKWMSDNYPNVTVKDAVQLNGANGGANVFYLYPDKVIDSGTDDQSVFVQVVPATFQMRGIQKLTKGYEEAYSNATAGVMTKRPYAIVRITGI